MLLYKEFDEKIGFSQEIKNILTIADNINHRKYKNDDVIIQRIYQNAAGYHADDDADSLRFDPAFQKILEKETLASQPTISRVNNKVNKEHMKQLQTANFNLLDKVYNIDPPEKIFLILILLIVKLMVINMVQLIIFIMELKVITPY